MIRAPALAAISALCALPLCGAAQRSVCPPLGDMVS